MTDDFLDNLSRPRPDPGGGAAAAHGGLLALALVEKIARLEARRRQASAHGVQSRFKPRERSRINRDEQEVLWASSLARVQALKRELSLLQNRDTAAYLRLAEARRSEPTGPVLAQAWAEAIQCPVLMIKASTEAAELLSLVGMHCSKHLLPDLQVAAEFLAAALRGAYHIAMANVNLASDDAPHLLHIENIPELLAAAEDRFQDLRDRLEMSAVLRRR